MAICMQCIDSVPYILSKCCQSHVNFSGVSICWTHFNSSLRLLQDIQETYMAKSALNLLEMHFSWNYGSIIK